MAKKYSIWIRIFMKLFKKWISVIVEDYELEITKLKKIVAHDTLTGALSRTEFNERIKHILSLLKRNGANHYFSIAYVDINNFKNINDEYGHEAGDNILIYFVQFLETHLRESDFVARFGGDEFVLFLGESDIESGEKVLKKLEFAFSNCKLPIGNKEINASFSYGVASTSEGIDNMAELLMKADRKMYEQKKRKKIFNT